MLLSYLQDKVYVGVGRQFYGGVSQRQGWDMYWWWFVANGIMCQGEGGRYVYWLISGEHLN
ncbi:hypothetical protein EON65_52045 [archaeon]|nr:MAG: hypothetical protein EON65_52045 [archaeon]